MRIKFAHLWGSENASNHLHIWRTLSVNFVIRFPLSVFGEFSINRIFNCFKPDVEPFGIWHEF